MRIWGAATVFVGVSSSVLFASPLFLFAFLPISVAAYALARSGRSRNAVLIAASLIFYGWGDIRHAPLILALTFFNYWAARAIDAASGRPRGWALAAGVTVNLGVLGVFKYAAFVVEALDPALGAFGLQVRRPEIELPLGISFFTFHCLSYLIDTYRRRFRANRRLSEVALYIFLFPQLIAGPIVRYKSIAARLSRRRHTAGRASLGISLFVVGLAQKVLIADSLGPVAEAVFDRLVRPTFVEAWLGASAYTLQIYFDFAGYSSMAIGLGLIFGFRLPRNFRRPYASGSVTEFWRRWHISLSTWFRDYLYIPLGGNRGPAWRTARNLLLVFLLCGLWHGAAWTFVLWGAWHGAFLIVERLGLRRRLAATPAPWARIYTLLVVVFGWVLFRSDSAAGAVGIWQAMLGLHGVSLAADIPSILRAEQFVVLPLAALMAVVRVRPRRLRPAKALVPNLATAALTALCAARLASDTYSPFLYFRF